MLSDLRGEGKEVVLVSSGAIAAGRQAFGHHKRPDSLAEKQAFAAVGQARLMMVYQKLCSEYNQTAAQVLLTRILWSMTVPAITHRTPLMNCCV